MTAILDLFLSGNPPLLDPEPFDIQNSTHPQKTTCSETFLSKVLASKMSDEEEDLMAQFKEVQKQFMHKKQAEADRQQIRSWSADLAVLDITSHFVSDTKGGNSNMPRRSSERSSSRRTGSEGTRTIATCGGTR